MGVGSICSLLLFKGNEMATSKLVASGGLRLYLAVASCSRFICC